MQDQLESLEAAIQAFLDRFDQVAISASRPVNDLLDMWGMAITVDQSVAAPLEALLTALVGRELTTAGELEATMDKVLTAIEAMTVSSTT